MKDTVEMTAEAYWAGLKSQYDFTPAWYDKSYDLRKLEGIDIVASYWMGPDIAHVFVSFAFAGSATPAFTSMSCGSKGPSERASPLSTQSP